MENITLIAAIGGLVFGVVGAVLGVINTWKAFDRDKVRLKVVPLYTLYESGEQGLAIEVTNLSYFAVTITEVGFTLRGSDERLVFLPPLLTGFRPPQRMEPRTRFTAYLDAAACHHPGFATVNVACATTACGQRFSGTSPALNQHVRRAASKHDTQ